MVKLNMNLTKKHFSLKHMRGHVSRDRQFNNSKWTLVRGQPSAWQVWKEWKVTSRGECLKGKASSLRNGELKKKNILYSSAIVPHLKTLSCAFFFTFLQRPSVTSDLDRLVFLFYKEMAQIKWFLKWNGCERMIFFFLECERILPIQVFAFSSSIPLSDCPFKTDFS